MLNQSLLFHQFLALSRASFFCIVGFFIFGESLLEDLIGSIHICAGEGRSDAAAVVNCDESIVVPSLEVARHPVTPLSCRHAPVLALPGECAHLDSVDLVETNGFAVTEGEKVTFDDHSVVPDYHVLILIKDVLSHYYNSNKVGIIILYSILIL